MARPSNRGRGRRYVPAVLALVGIPVMAVVAAIGFVQGWSGLAADSPTSGSDLRPTNASTRSAPGTPSTPASSVLYTQEGWGTKELAVTDPRVTRQPVLFSAAHAGTGPLSVTVLDDEGETQEVLVARDGPYQGSSVLFPVIPDEPDQPGSVPTSSGEVRTLLVKANDGWTITISELSTAPELTGTATGTGDQVLRYESSGGIAAFTHEGVSDFAVFYDNGEPEILFEGIGKLSQEGRLRPGPGTVEIDAIGPWRLSVG